MAEGLSFSHEHDHERARVLALVQRHGRNTTAFQALEQGFRYAFYGEDACVAYVDTGGAWVAAGAPLAPHERLAAVADAFVEEARTRGRRAILFATETRFAQAANAMPSLLVGEQPTWDPTTWDATVRSARSLREQLRRARAKNVTVERLAGGSLLPGARARVAIDALVARWLSTRSMAPMGFLVHVEPFSFIEERRLYAAWSGERLVAFLALVPIYGREGFFFEDLLRERDAPNGTAELLFDGAMRELATEGVRYATFGLAPLAGSVERGFALARTWGRPLYDFAGLHAFKQKLRPASWEPVYLSYPRGASSLLATYDVLSAFSRRGLLRFGLETILRGPDVVVRALAATLMPWTLALASVDSARWFPAPWIQWAWVAFDVVLIVGLSALILRWRRALATALAIAITLDASVTAIEALAWNARHLRAPTDVIALLLAVAAPTLAAIVMWNARARRSPRARPRTPTLPSCSSPSTA